uniref:Candidate secreted effector n=1 Tax=Meloidogyne incognita TaxID=6306 RepID=A0A914NAT0_MELIC
MLLDGFLCVSISLICVVESNLQLVDIRFKLLLYTQSFLFTTALSFKRSLHTFKCTLMVFASIFEFLFLLLYTLLDFRADL